MEDFAEMFFRGVRYEQWMRFHFIQDVPGKEDEALISLPPAVAERSLREEPEFAELLNMLDGRQVSLERTRDALASWTCSRLGITVDGKKLAGYMLQLTEDREFLHLMEMHNGWIQELADRESASPERRKSPETPSFSVWSAAFYRWLEDKGQSSSAGCGS